MEALRRANKRPNGTYSPARGTANGSFWSYLPHALGGGSNGGSGTPTYSRVAGNGSDKEHGRMLDGKLQSRVVRLAVGLVVVISSLYLLLQFLEIPFTVSNPLPATWSNKAPTTIGDEFLTTDPTSSSSLTITSLKSQLQALNDKLKAETDENEKLLAHIVSIRSDIDKLRVAQGIDVGEIKPEDSSNALPTIPANLPPLAALPDKAKDIAKDFLDTIKDQGKQLEGSAEDVIKGKQERDKQEAAAGEKLKPAEKGDKPKEAAPADDGGLIYKGPIDEIPPVAAVGDDSKSKKDSVADALAQGVKDTVDKAEKKPGDDAQPVADAEAEAAHGKLAPEEHAGHNANTRTYVRIGGMHPAFAAVSLKDTKISDLTPEESATGKQCDYFMHHHAVDFGKSWGTLNEEQQKQWAELKCDDIFPKLDVVGRAKYRAVRLQAGEEQAIQRTPLKPMQKNKKVAKGSIHHEEPIVSVIVCSTTRFIYDIDDPADLTLFNAMLPSLVNSAEPGYEYWIYISYDVGDLYFDQESMQQTVRKWYDAHVTEPLKARGIKTQLGLIPFNNNYGKPGPAFNYALRKAYDDGTDYFFRINDDTTLAAPWAAHFISNLQALGPPIYGMTGPMCRQGNTGILTHDFTHRTHMEIFEMDYYPPVFMAWYMDDWISRVYGQQRTIYETRTEAIHAVEAHGTRYKIDFSLAELLDSEVEKGKQKIVAYMKKHKAPQQMIDDYINDSFKFAASAPKPEMTLVQMPTK